jgi:hypothetical protein
MNLGRKFLNEITPYNRSFMVIDAGSEADFGIATVPIKLPLINTVNEKI